LLDELTVKHSAFTWHPRSRISVQPEGERRDSTRRRRVHQSQKLPQRLRVVREHA